MLRYAHFHSSEVANWLIGYGFKYRSGGTGWVHTDGRIAHMYFQGDRWFAYFVQEKRT